MRAARIERALRALVTETERCDRPGIYGVGADDPAMVEARAWQDAQRPTGDPIHTVEQFQARVREIALRMRVMPRVAKEVSHV